MNLIEIKSNLAQYIKSKNENITVYSEDKTQGIKYPCMFINLIESSNLKIANINYGKVYTLDLIYIEQAIPRDNYSSIEDILNKIKIDNDSVYIEHQESTIVDKILHHQIEVTVVNDNLNNIETSNPTYKLVVDTFKLLGDNVFYQVGNLKELKNGIFVVEPTSVETSNTSINGKKEYTRNITIRYATTNEDIINSDVASFLEDKMYILLKELLQTNKIIKANYELELNNISGEYKGIPVATYQANLEIVERK